MVKRTSSLASNEKFQVRFLVELLKHKIGKGNRMATGSGWKPAELARQALRVRLPLLRCDRNIWRQRSTAELEYMLQEPDVVVRIPPARFDGKSLRRSSAWIERRKFSDT